MGADSLQLAVGWQQVSFHYCNHSFDVSAQACWLINQTTRAHAGREGGGKGGRGEGGRDREGESLAHKADLGDGTDEGGWRQIR